MCRSLKSQCNTSLIDRCAAHFLRGGPASGERRPKQPLPDTRQIAKWQTRFRTRTHTLRPASLTLTHTDVILAMRLEVAALGPALRAVQIRVRRVRACVRACASACAR